MTSNKETLFEYGITEAATKRGSRAVTSSREKFLARRKTGIGGSDIGTILGLNPYKSAAQLFNEKLGLFADSGDSMAAFMGRFMEDHVATLWQYWGGDQESTMQNYAAKRKVRTCAKSPEMLRHEAHPWLVANIDRYILTPRPGVLEIKTINQFYADKWALGIPPAYQYQAQHYLLVTDLDYCEFAVLTGGNSLSVFGFEASREMQQHALDAAADFWQRIERARPTADAYLKESNKANPDRRRLLDLAGEAARHEPPADASPAYEEFMRKRYRTPSETNRPGSDSELQVARQYARLQGESQRIEEQLQAARNKLLSAIAAGEGLDFGDSGRVTWKANAKGSRCLRVALKD